MLGIQANHKCEVRTPNINNFPLTTTDAAPERGGGTHELADSVTRDHVSDCRSAGMRGEGNRAVGPAASSSSIIILSCSLAPSADSQAVAKHLNMQFCRIDGKMQDFVLLYSEYVGPKPQGVVLACLSWPTTHHVLGLGTCVYWPDGLSIDI